MATRFLLPSMMLGAPRKGTRRYRVKYYDHEGVKQVGYVDALSISDVYKRTSQYEVVGVSPVASASSGKSRAKASKKARKTAARREPRDHSGRFKKGTKTVAKRKKSSKKSPWKRTRKPKGTVRTVRARSGNVWRISTKLVASGIRKRGTKKPKHATRAKKSTKRRK